MNMYLGLLTQNQLLKKKILKSTSEKENSKKLVKKQDGFLKLHVEDVLVTIMKCTTRFHSALNVILGIINIVTFLKTKVSVNPVFCQKIIKLKNQELTSVNFAEQEDFCIFL